MKEIIFHEAGDARSEPMPDLKLKQATQKITLTYIWLSRRSLI